MPRIQNPDGTITTWEAHEGPPPVWEPAPEPAAVEEEAAPSNEEESTEEAPSPSPRSRRS